VADHDLGRGDDRFMRGAYNRQQPTWKSRRGSKPAKKKSGCWIFGFLLFSTLYISCHVVVAIINTL